MTSSAKADTTTDLDLAIVTPTQDVDVALEVAHAKAVVACLEDAGLSPSTEESEQGFTWIRDDLKIQLVRPFHPFPNDTAKPLPANTHLSLLAKEEHRLLIAFDSSPEEPRLQSANAAALVALKQVAFGRKRPDGSPVERDFHDVFLVISTRPDELEAAYRAADYHVRSLVDRALEHLVADGPEVQAAARQHSLISGDPRVAEHQQAVTRAAVFMRRRLAA
jgi:hypothetical protein